MEQLGIDVGYGPMTKRTEINWWLSLDPVEPDGPPNPDYRDMPLPLKKSILKDLMGQKIKDIMADYRRMADIDMADYYFGNVEDWNSAPDSYSVVQKIVHYLLNGRESKARYMLEKELSNETP